MSTLGKDVTEAAEGGNLEVALQRELQPQQFGDLDEFNAPEVAAEILDVLINEGADKRLTIVHKPWGGNDLFFYDQNTQLIQDAYSLHTATRVFFTNQARLHGEPLVGRVLLDVSVPIQGLPSLRNKLELQYNTGGRYEFNSEYSFWAWAARDPATFVARAFLS